MGLKVLKLNTDINDINTNEFVGEGKNFHT